MVLTDQHFRAKKPLAEMTCEDLLGLKETLQPEAIH